MNTLRAYDCVERLECFSREESSRPKAADMFDKVEDDVKLGLVEPANGPTRCGQEKVVNLFLE